jgi:hypothetical protein
MSLTQWLLLLLLSVAAITVVSRLARRWSLFTQFLILLSIGICISFLLLAIVQLPEDRPWLSTFLVVSVFVASPVAVRLFLHGLREENANPDELTTDGPRPNPKDGPV